jgi:hypothetical protein
VDALGVRFGRIGIVNGVATLKSGDPFDTLAWKAGTTIRFQVLYVFLVLAHDRRRILHVAVTAHPTAEWTGHGFCLRVGSVVFKSRRVRKARSGYTHRC